MDEDHRFVSRAQVPFFASEESNVSILDDGRRELVAEEAFLDLASIHTRLGLVEVTLVHGKGCLCHRVLGAVEALAPAAAPAPAQAWA